MAYTDHYERDIYGVIAFWVQNHFEHGRFFDREISHHEIELARENDHAVQRLAAVLNQAESKSTDIGILLDEAYHATNHFRGLLTETLDKHMRCELVISTPHLLLDHMKRETEEALIVFKLLRSGEKPSAAQASVHENYFWLRIMADHVGFIRHYSDPMNYEFNERLNGMIRTFDDLFLQANALKGMTRKGAEMYPSLCYFNQTTIEKVKNLEKFKLELDDLIKQCAVLTTSPPDLLEHIAREAHHFYRNLEEMVIQ